MAGPLLPYLPLALGAAAAVRAACAAPAAGPGPAPAAGPDDAADRPKGPTVVGILVFEGVELLDFTGPAEVFAVAGHGSMFKVVTVAESKTPFATMGGLTFVPSHTYDDAPPLGVLVVPGGNMRAVTARGLAWLKATADATPITMSVCMGSMLLARAGSRFAAMLEAERKTKLELLAGAGRRRIVIDEAGRIGEAREAPLAKGGIT